MITTRIGITEFKGDYPEIIADYSSITLSMFEYMTEEVGMDGEEAKEKLMAIFNDNFKSLDEKVEDVIEKLVDSGADFIANVLGKALASIKEVREGDNNGSK